MPFPRAFAYFTEVILKVQSTFSIKFTNLQSLNLQIYKFTFTSLKFTNSLDISLP